MSQPENTSPVTTDSGTDTDSGRASYSGAFDSADLDMGNLSGTPTHNVVIGYVLWIFGFLGSHRFYFGKPVSGTIWFLTLGLFYLLVNGFTFLMASWVVPGFEVTTYWWAVLGALLVSIVSAFIGKFVEDD